MKVLAKQKINARIGVRERLIISLFISLATTGKINTTNRKARALKSFADNMIGMILSKKTPHDQNNIRAKLKHNKRFDEVYKKLSGLPMRSGGYVSIIGAGTRKGDNAAMSDVSILDYEKLTKPSKSSKAEAGSESKKEKGQVTKVKNKS